MIRKRNDSGGFTLVEMLVVAPILILVIGTFIGVIVSITGEVLASRGASALSFDVQDALNRIEQDIKLSGGFLATNNIELTSPQGYNDDATDFHNVDANGTMLILNMPATKQNPVNSQDYVYANGQPYLCASGLESRNIKLTFNVVYFVKNDTLWRRVLAPSNYLTGGCSVPWQKPSCSPDISEAFCAVSDIRLVDGVTPENFKIDYYTNVGSTTPLVNDDPSDANRQITLRSANTAVVSIFAERTIAGREIKYSGLIRSTSKNDSYASAIVLEKPGAPTSLTATPGSGQITLNWIAPADDGGTDITNYKIYRGTSSNNKVLYTMVGNTLTYTDTGTGTTRYYYQVKAVNPIGDSSSSNEVNAVAL